MAQRIVVIWFPHLLADWQLRRRPELASQPFAMALMERNRRVVKAVNTIAQQKGVYPEMLVADCRAMAPELEVFDYDPQQPQKLLSALAEWCIRFTPVVSIDMPDGLVLDANGCPHLWGGESDYINEIKKRFAEFGYTTRIGMADTIGCAWAVSRFESQQCIVKSNTEGKAIAHLPPAALRLEPKVVDKLTRLGLRTIGSFMKMPGPSLRRRFGEHLLQRLDQALGSAIEHLEPVEPLSPYQERLPSLEPIRTAVGIEIALKELLESLCQRLSKESMGLRKCELRCYRLDGNIQRIEIGTNKPSRNTAHLFKLFELKIPEIEPDLGIELFVMEARVVEELQNSQDALWAVSGANESALAELVDRLEGKTGEGSVHRYLPSEHYWPEHSFKRAGSLSEKPSTLWRSDLPRPLHLLPKPEKIDVMVPVPD